MLSVKALLKLIPHALFATTEIIPDDVPEVTVIEVVVEVPDQPEGNVQVWLVAPLTAAIE